MRVYRTAALAALFTVFMIVVLAGCGDVFRPIVVPIIGGSGDPQTFKQAIVISTAGTTLPGVATSVNLSGDTVSGQVTVGIDPSFASFYGASNSATMVSNKTENTMSSYSTFVALGATANTITLPTAPNAAPGASFGLKSGTNFYVTFPGRD